MSLTRACLVTGLLLALVSGWTPGAAAQGDTAQEPAPAARRGERGARAPGARPGQGFARGERRQRGAGQAAGERGAERPSEPALPKAWMDALQWRSIGPANMSGRITALAVYEADPTTWWAATASGGLLKTTNDGRTFEHQFDHEATVSIGDVQVAQSDPQIVWVGTGESNPRNSVSWGNGVYKSTDGGATWEHMGLEASYQIGRIAIHPEDPDVVYVGALGRLWGENEERGLYKTTDGGATWDKLLHVDERTGVVDVDLMPGSPDTLLVATYERQRDGFDTNDPAKRWGPGSGIWRSTDAGATFERVTEGLPSCELGRVELEYWRGDPSVVFALVESSRIGLEPENAAWAGFSGTDADVGARLTEVVEDGPAAKAGLKAGDLVVRLEDETVQSWSDLVAKVRRHLAGDTVAIEVSRERKSVQLELTFARHPDSVEDKPATQPPAEEATEQATEQAAEPAVDEEAQEGRAGAQAVPEQEAQPAGAAREAAAEASRSSESEAETEQESSEESEEEDEPQARAPFRGSLGGQIANAQEQQGPEGHEYGGLYRSTDGGLTWTRINSINPRPMYFSRVRVDPSDQQRIYVLGVPLYRSEDGGETFTDDGARRGVHVDHHALWIDPRDGRHAILGNDGGIYVTRDRFETWDHLNHVAIGQFYHVAVGPRVNYRVYGGLQDNGTWGGPSRVRNGSGSRNEDWISIGGGDGFLVRVDPNDPDQVYFESQNGGLGRRNLRTGERGSMRPRAPRGTRYRWNWRTPFLLSSHNSGIYYTAGNHVFRSWLHGDELQAISPEISNTDRGSATALAESPLDAGLLYVGTDDGALWQTRNGGNDWTNLFLLGRGEERPAERGSGPIAAGSNGAGSNGAHAQEAAAPAAGEQEQAAPASPIDGRWVVGSPAASGPPVGARSAGRRRGGGGGGGFDMEVELKLAEDGTLSGALHTVRGESELASGSFDAETGALRATFGSGGFVTTLEGRVEGETLTGTLDFGGRFQRELEAKRQRPGAKQQRDDGYDWKPIHELVGEPMWVSALETSAFEAGRVYLTLDGHRSDDDAPHVFVSEDHGETWRSLTGGLPPSSGSARVIREDIENPDLLYLGCEFGAWVSIDRGATWTRMNSNLPTVAVHEFAQHSTNGELVAGTHGRSLWALDVTPLRQLSREAVAAEARLYRPNAATYWRSEPRSGGTLRRFEGQNPPDDAALWYSLGRDARGVQLRVKRLDGELLAELETASEAGLHVARWNLRPVRPDQQAAPRGGRGGFRRGAPRVEPGTYLVELRVGSQTLTQPLVVRGDPEFPDTVLWGEEHERQMEIEALLSAGGEDE